MSRIIRDGGGVTRSEGEFESKGQAFFPISFVAVWFIVKKLGIKNKDYIRVFYTNLVFYS